LANGWDRTNSTSRLSYPLTTDPKPYYE